MLPNLLNTYIPKNSSVTKQINNNNGLFRDALNIFINGSVCVGNILIKIIHLVNNKDVI